MKQKEIKNHRHEFNVLTERVVVNISFKDGWWRADVVEGNTGCGSMTGGSYKNADEYIKEIEKNHRYCYYFFNQGHKAAKANYLK